MTSRVEAEAFARLEVWRDDMGGCVVCGVSGGVDSMALLELCRRWGGTRGVRVTAAHLHHGLRGETADRDAAFVADWCRAHGIPLTLERADTDGWAAEHGLTVEEAGRQLRYALFRRAAEREGAGLILTAHHADDNAETMLLNLCRGTGLAGLTGIPPRRGNIARPLLALTRAEIDAWASENGVPHVEDETNETDFAARNLLRHQVLPVLRQVNPRAAENMARTAAALRRENEALEALLADAMAQVKVTPSGAAIPAAALASVPEALRPRLLLEVWKAMEGGRRDLGAVHLDALASLSPGAHLDLPHGFFAHRETERLVIEQRLDVPETRPLAIPGETAWGGYTIRCRTGGGPGDLTLRAGEALTVGPWPQKGRLTLAGSRGARSVKRLLADRGISPEEREGLPALYTLSGVLAAVWPLGVDSAYAPAGGEPAVQIDIEKRRK